MPGKALVYTDLGGALAGAFPSLAVFAVCCNFNELKLHSATVRRRSRPLNQYFYDSSNRLPFTDAH
ncbi:MAG: hypothetical protein ACI8W7_003728 [Gammaproteobacteria bacterium]|jgi:hypothetical protein